MSRNISASMKTASVWVQVLIKKKELMEIFLQAGKFKKRTADKSAIRFFCEILPKAGKRLAPAAVMIPATQMERELMAPSDGPISITCTVAGRTHGRPAEFLYLWNKTFYFLIFCY